MKILNKISWRFLNTLFLSNIISFISLAIIPAKARKENLIFIMLINLIFLGMTTIFSIITYKIFSIKGKVIKKKNDKKDIDKNINLLIITPILGIIFLLYDRIISRKINYLNGLRQARYEWLASSGGNFLGLLANLMIPFGYIAIFFLIIFYEKIKPFKIKWLVLSSLISIIGHAALNGGRSNLLLASVTVIIARLLRNKIKWKNKLRAKLIFIFIGMIAIIFIFTITLSSAKMSGINMKKLLELGIISLYGTPNEEWFQKSKSTLIYLFMYALTYLYHGQWTTQILYELEEQNGTYLFYTLGFILNKLKVIDEPFQSGYFSTAGAFVSLVGSFYYELKFLGVLIFSIVFGILLGWVFVILKNKKRIGGVAIAYITYILFIAILSPILPAYGLVYLNFIVFSFILLEIINRIIFKNKLNFLE